MVDALRLERPRRRLDVARRWVGRIGVLLAMSSNSLGVTAESGSMPRMTERVPAAKSTASNSGTTWTSPRALPDSTGALQWSRPKQARMADIHRTHPAYLPSSETHDLSPLSADLSPGPMIQPVAHQEPVKLSASSASAGSSRRIPTEDDALPLEPLRLVPPRRATPIPAAEPTAARPRTARPLSLISAADDAELPSAEEPLPGAEEVFDDVLDQLLPGDQPQRPAQPAVPTERRPQTPIPEFEDDLGNEPALPAEAPLPESDLPPADDSAATRKQAPAAEPNADADDEIENIFGDDALPDEMELPSPEDEGREDEPATQPSPSDQPSLPPALEENRQPTPAAPLPRPMRPNPPAPMEVPGQDERPRDLLEGDDADRYNGRDCEAETMNLQAAWEELRRTPIRSITLDISPSIKPNESDADKERSRQVNLSRAPSRVWRGRDGRVLAEGKMLDFKNGQVIVEDRDGQQEKLSWYQLSNEELCFVTAWWELPSEFIPVTGPYRVRNWTMTTFTWKASGLCHKPLYFEEVALERYGHSAEPVTQTFLSGAHFFGNIFFLPYHLGLNPPNECQYALGYYRPGSCAPWLLPAVPLDARAARMQVGAIVGGLTFLP